MADLNVVWETHNLQDFLPSSLTSLVQDVLVPITDFIGSAAALTKANFELLKASSSFSVPSVDPVLLGIQASLNTLNGLLTDLKSAGGSLLLVPPQPGGTTSFGNVVRTALANMRNPEVPDFSESAAVACFGMLVSAPDSVGVRLMYDDLVLSVSVSDNIVRKLGIDTLVGTGRFVSHDLSFKIAGSASPQPDTPWVTMQASQFIPKSLDIVSKITQYLSAINTQIVVNPFDKIIDIAQQTADKAAALASSLQVTADFIEAVFHDLPIHFFRVEPQTGGTKSISESTKNWFDVKKQTQLVDVAANAWVAGYIVVIGASTLSETTNVYNIWNDLFFP